MPDISRKKANPFHVYEAVLDSVLFEAIGRDEQDAKAEMIAWLDEYTGGYEIRDFYLKDKEAW